VRIQRNFVVFSALAALLFVSSQAQSGVSDGRLTGALAAVNAVRRRLGLAPLSVDANLNASAAAHSRYRALNGAASESFHSETRGRQGYSSADPFQRMRFHGYRGEPAAENGIAYFGAEGNPVEGWLAAPYHRVPMLHPHYRDIGLGFANGTDSWYVTANFGYGVDPEIGERAQVVCYPANGQTNVPTAWTEPESPNPLRIHRAAQPAGYVVSFSYYSGYEPQIRLLQASLETKEGDEVACFLNHPGNDSFLSKNTVLLIPKRPLAPAQTYRATVRANVVGASTVERTWTFTTEGRRVDIASGSGAGMSNTAHSRR
jgi:uncharacterized protein YkwD